MKEYLTFDDVLIRPSYSDIESRVSVSTAPDFLGLNMTTPIISANMDYVTGPKMAVAMHEAGGLGILHRFATPDLLYLNAQYVHDQGVRLAVSVGTRDFKETMHRVADYYGIDPNVIVTVDVAHGDSKKVVELVEALKDRNLTVIAGNVATREGFLRLAQAGADAVKIGIGPGSVCTTRTVTGVGVPQLSAIMEIHALRKFHSKYYNVKLIADGGIKSSGDITKAIGAGADVVMLGHLLAGTSETPGEALESPTGTRFRPYRGQSIFGTNGYREVPEGVSGYVEERGSVIDIVRRLTAGLRSGMSYVGATTIAELQENCEFIRVSPMSHIESGTRVKTTI